MFKLNLSKTLPLLNQVQQHRQKHSHLKFDNVCLLVQIYSTLPLLYVIIIVVINLSHSTLNISLFGVS